MEELIAKANILMEALPWIKRFNGKTIVIKYGGNAMPALFALVAPVVWQAARPRTRVPRTRTRRDTELLRDIMTSWSEEKGTVPSDLRHSAAPIPDVAPVPQTLRQSE